VLHSTWRRHALGFRGFRVVAVVRNPLDRFLSFWDFGQRNEAVCHKMGLDFQFPLEALVEYVLSVPPAEQNWHVRPQTLCLTLEGKWLGTDHIRFERFSAEVFRVLGSLGCKLAQVPHVNQSTAPPARRWSQWAKLPGSQRHAVIEHFQQDFENLGYEP